MSSDEGKNQQRTSEVKSADPAPAEGSPGESNDVAIAMTARLYPPLEDVKDRFAEVLGRIKTRVDGMKSSPIGPEPPSVSVHSGRLDSIGAAVLKARGVTIDPAPPAAVIDAAPDAATAELDRRKENFMSLLQAAESRVRNAEERRRQSEASLAEEVARREKAERRVHEIEQSFHSKVNSLETEELKLMEAQEALEKAQAQLKAETEAHAATETALNEARTALNEANQKLSLAANDSTDAESRAHAAAEQVRKAAAKLKDKEKALKLAEEKAVSAEQTLHEVESMVNESHAMTNEMQQKYKQMEDALRHETELRLFAEQQLKALVEELHLNLGGEAGAPVPNDAAAKKSNLDESANQTGENPTSSKTSQQRVALTPPPGSVNGIMKFNRTTDESLALIDPMRSMTQARDLSIVLLIASLLYSIIAGSFIFAPSVP